MGDVQRRVGRQRHGAAGQQESGVGAAVALHHLGHGGHLGRTAIAADLAQLEKRHRPAQLGAFGHALGQRAKHPLDGAASLSQRAQ